ncbi:hypothetical protein CCACVL1_04176 [Corchorus capsularis]|uniref:Uncharacterized protein n=1 Tax=Corchorus capsularis TaxID=210143 RepID=A0A1R3JUS7_COCAP|nr:hypothetical protein CCACVL1_04176 [Corchorus capsularis]
MAGELSLISLTSFPFNSLDKSPQLISIYGFSKIESKMR